MIRRNVLRTSEVRSTYQSVPLSKGGFRGLSKLAVTKYNPLTPFFKGE